MAAGEPPVTVHEEEFMNSWFPDLDTNSYIVPVEHLDQIQTQSAEIGDVPACVLRRNDECSVSTVQEIKERDDTHKSLHLLLARLKNQAGKGEVMVMMTQASFSMYGSLATAAGASFRVSRTGEVPLEDIKHHKHKHSDLIILSKQKGVLLGVVQSFHAADPETAKNKLAGSVDYLAEAARSIKELVRTVPGAEDVTVHMTLILPNITRAQLEILLQELQTEARGVPCLCKDDMATDEGLKHWWQNCWSSGRLDFNMDSEIYRHIVTRFVIPTTRVEIYLTTQPRLQLKHEHDVVNAVGDIYGAEVFQAGLHQLSLFPKQAELLDIDHLDDQGDDVKILWGPPGTGKTILLLLRALQWVKYFSVRHIFILQTRKDATAASCLVEYQLQQTLNAQQQRTRHSGDPEQTPCTFSHFDMSGHWSWKEKLHIALGLHQRGQSHTAINIVADEAKGDAVASVCQWLKEEEGVTTVRLWAAGVEAFQDEKNIPASMQHAVCQVTEALRCPGSVVQEVMKATQIMGGKVPPYDAGWQLTSGPAVVVLRHGRDGHAGDHSWHCGQCANNIAATLRSLHVAQSESNDEQKGLSANDVFILGSHMDCALPDENDWSPAPLINVLQDNGYNVRTLSSRSTRDEFMAVVKRDVTPPAITVANEKCVLGLERKIVVYCGGGGGDDADWSGRLVAFSRTTSLLIYVRPNQCKCAKKNTDNNCNEDKTVICMDLIHE